MDNEGFSTAVCASPSGGGAQGDRPAGLRITIAPKEGAFTRTPSFLDTDVEPISANEKKKLAERIDAGPSSKLTVLSMAGLFAVGLMLILSGIIVLLTEWQSAEFIWTGAIFLLVGIVCEIICFVLQRKNLSKYVHQLEQDLYFMQVSENPVWRRVVDSIDAGLPNNGARPASTVSLRTDG